jgi:hypothetical protein
MDNGFSTILKNNIYSKAGHETLERFLILRKKDLILNSNKK